MLKRFYGFYTSYPDFAILNISKYGIKREFEGDHHRPVIARLYYYVDVEMNVIEDSDIRYLVEYSKVSDELKNHLKDIRQQYISLCRSDYVSELQFFDKVSEIDAPITKYETVDFDYATDCEYNSYHKNKFRNYENYYRNNDDDNLN